MRVPIVPVALVNAALVLALFAATPNAVRGQTNCTCRYAGQSFALSTCACIVMPNGVQRACCGMVLNNPSWNFTGDVCPVAGIPDRVPTQSAADRLLPTAQETLPQDGGWHIANTESSGKPL